MPCRTTSWRRDWIASGRRSSRSDPDRDERGDGRAPGSPARASARRTREPCDPSHGSRGSRAMDRVNRGPAGGATPAVTLTAETARSSTSTREPGGRQRPSLWSAIKTLHRTEVGPVYFFVLVWGMTVAARQPSDLWSAPAILAFLINGLSLFSGFVLNNYSDYPIDRRSRIKGYVADAVERIGR